MSQPQTLDQVPPMASPTEAQRPLGERTEVQLDRFPAARAPAPTTHAPPGLALVDPEQEDTSVAIHSLEELDQLASQAFVRPEQDSDESQQTVIEEDEHGLYEPASVDAIHIDTERAPVIDESTFHARVAEHCADRLLAMARDRWTRPLRERADTEPRMFAQVDAIACIGELGVQELLDWCPNVGTAAATWVTVFALGCMGGREPLEAIVALVAELPSDHAVRAGEAFASSPCPHAVPLARALLATSVAPAQAAAVELLSRRGLMTASDALAWIGRGEPIVKSAAVRALLRIDDVTRAPDEVTQLIGHDDPEVCWEASRACTIWGNQTAYGELRKGGSLTQKLGLRAAEIYVLMGEPSDLEPLERIIAGLDVTGSVLSAVSRFGHVLIWSFLSHYLTQPLLQRDALVGLRTLYGDCVAKDEALDPRAWKDAIARLGLDEELRYRHGQPWSPAVVGTELLDWALTARELSDRLDELRARAGVISATSVPLHSWRDAPERQLRAVAEQAEKAARGFRAGSWWWR